MKRKRRRCQKKERNECRVTQLFYLYLERKVERLNVPGGAKRAGAAFVCHSVGLASCGQALSTVLCKTPKSLSGAPFLSIRAGGLFFLCIANIFLSAGTASFCLLPFLLHGRKTTISCAPAIPVDNDYFLHLTAYLER